MRTRMWIPLVLLAAAFAGRLSASEGMDDFVKLAKSGANEEVMLAYIEASPVAYQPTVDEIVYLRDLGLSDTVISALMKRGETLRLAAAKGDAAPAVQPAAPPPQPVVAPEAPQVTETREPSIQAPVIGRPAPEAVIAPPSVPPQEGIVSEPVREVVTDQPAPLPEQMAPPVVTAPPGEVNVSYFYESLSPYGRWVSVNDVWVWQPTVVVTDRTWRPYCHRGHWLYTDSGWAWSSDYSWGWAPFHYGRWTMDVTYGWVWTPDTVWGPAWVHWRQCDTHLAWAPLPPAARYEAGVGFHFRGKHVDVDFSFGLGERDYTYVPVARFCEPRLVVYREPPERVTVIYNRTTVIRETYVYSNNRIINNGPPVAHVQVAVGREIKPVKIVDADVKPGQPLRGETLRKDRLAVYRPQVAATAPESPPAVAQRQEAARKQAAQRVAAQRVAAQPVAAQPRPTGQANQAADLREAELRRQQSLSAAEAAKHKDAADAANLERKRLEKAADNEPDRKKAEALRAAAQMEKQKEADAHKERQQAEDQAAAHEKAAKQAARDQERAAKEAADTARATQRQQELGAKREQAAAQAAAEAAKREQAKREAQAQREQTDAQRKAQAAADAAAKEQARREAANRQEQTDAQRKAQAAAEAAAKEQARRETATRQEQTEAQRKAQAAAEAAAKEQAHKAPAAPEPAVKDQPRKAPAQPEPAVKDQPRQEPAARRDPGETQRPRQPQPTPSTPTQAPSSTLDPRLKDATDAAARQRQLDADAATKRRSERDSKKGD